MDNLNINFPLIISKFDTILERGLCSGIGNPSGQMCIEAAITQAMGLPFNDEPECVEPVVREYKIALNDCYYWKSPKSRAKGLRSLGIAQIGSKGVVDGAEFSMRLSKVTIQHLIPALFDEFYPGQFTRLVEDCRVNGTTTSAKALGHTAKGYATSAVFAASTNRACGAANAASCAATTAFFKGIDGGEKYLLLSASLALQILRDLKSPGCDWV